MKIECLTICKIEKICANINLRHIFNITMLSQKSCFVIYHDDLCLCQDYENYCHIYFAMTIALTIVCILFLFSLFTYFVFKKYQKKKAEIDVESVSAESKTPTVASSVYEDEEEQEESSISRNQGDRRRHTVGNVKFKNQSSVSTHNKADLKAVLDKLLTYAQTKECEMKTADSDFTQSSNIAKETNAAADEDLSELSYKTRKNIKQILTNRLNKARERKAKRQLERDK